MGRRVEGLYVATRVDNRGELVLLLKVASIAICIQRCCDGGQPRLGHLQVFHYLKGGKRFEYTTKVYQLAIESIAEVTQGLRGGIPQECRGGLLVESKCRVIQGVIR